MLSIKAMTGAVLVLAAGLASAAEPAEGAMGGDEGARVLSSLSAAAVIDAKLLPAARAAIAAEAMTWHRRAGARLSALPACRAAEPTKLAERPAGSKAKTGDEADGGLGPSAGSAVLRP